MANRSKADTDIRITIAAGLFAIHTRDAKEIARLVDTSERNIHRWAEREKWEEVLTTLGYPVNVTSGLDREGLPGIKSYSEAGKCRSGTRRNSRPQIPCRRYPASFASAVRRSTWVSSCLVLKQSRWFW